MEIAAATSGRAVLVSAVAVTIAMSGMFLSGNAVFVSFAAGTILVVAVAVIGSLTVLPAILAKLGDRIDRPRVPFLHRLRRPVGEPPRVWPGLMRVVLARPALSLAVGVAALLALAAPALSMNLRDTGAGRPAAQHRRAAHLRPAGRRLPAGGHHAHRRGLVADRARPRTRWTRRPRTSGAQSVATGLFAPGDWAPEYSPDGTVATIDLPARRTAPRTRGPARA